jgi:hypothetical protein
MKDCVLFLGHCYLIVGYSLMMGARVLVLLSLFSRQRFSADVTDSCFIEHSNTTSITAQDAS